MHPHKPGVVLFAAAKAAAIRQKRGDDLIRLPGIGIVAQDFLYRLGFNRIQHIANLTDLDIEKIERAAIESKVPIKLYPGRIEAWKKAAQEYLRRHS